jgi:hypothetical protein
MSDQQQVQSGTQPTAYIAYDTVRKDYALSEFEFGQVITLSKNNWKDITLVALPTALACVLNAISLSNSIKPFALTLPILLNWVFGAVAGGFFVAFGVVWWLTSNRSRDLIRKIKSRPMIPIQLAPENQTGANAILLRTSAQPSSPTLKGTQPLVQEKG